METSYQQDPAHNFKPRSITQKICIGIGVVFIFFGAAGLLYPEIAGGHFSLTMNFLHILSGIISFSVGNAQKRIYAYWFCVLGFVFMAGLGLAGIFFGEPGTPAVGFAGQDPLHLILIPRMVELGIVDHTINMALAVVFFIGIRLYQKKHHFKLFQFKPQGVHPTKA